MSYNLFLDDDIGRIPHKLTWIDLPLVEWTFVRNYNEFVKIIEKQGLPKILSLDHDLHSEHYKEYHRMINSDGIINYANMAEKTGYHCAVYLANYCIDKRVPVMQYYVHTMNCVGRENIVSVMETVKNVLKSIGVE